jgi:hypothetical protein
MPFRDWMDPRDGTHWKVRQTGVPPLLVFAAGEEIISVLVDFSHGLEDWSEGELQRLLDGERG